MIVERVVLSDVELTILTERIADRITDLSGSTKEARLRSLWRALNHGGGDCRVNVAKLRSFSGSTVADLCQHLDSHCFCQSERPIDPEEIENQPSPGPAAYRHAYVCRTYVNYMNKLGPVEVEEY